MAVLDSQCPLSGLRVTEIGDESAAYGARLLADLGAEVVMVEPLEGGVIRHIAPFCPPSAGGESYEHLFLNAGKRSVQLDLLAADGQQRLLDVIAQSDVLIDAGPRPPLPRAITSGMLRAARPDLVRVSVRPYGPEGPCRSWTGNDLTAQAAGGLLAISGDPRDPPTQGPVDCAFKLTGHAVASAVMIGLRSREQSGHGADFQVSAQEAVAFSVTQSANVNDFHIAGTIPVRPGLNNAVRCGDGRWAGANVRPDHYAEFLGLITAASVEHDYTPDDWERGTAGPNPLDNANMELAKSYAALVTRDEFVDSMQGTGQVAMPLYDLSEVASEPHYAECEQFTDISTGDATGWTSSLPQSPMRDLGIDVTLDPAPQLGADNSLLETIPRRRDTVSPVIAVASDPAKLLGGLRVVELSWILAGPIGGRMLANFGVEVIRIESSARPDALRNYRRPDGTAQPNLPGLFNCVNTGKRSLTLDLRQERAKELLRDLIGTADLVIDNYALGSLARMGFRYEHLAERNPGLVMLHMPGCGPRGRWSRERSLGNLLMAASGLNSLMGFEGRDPRGVGIAYPDFIAPHLLVTLALAAIQMRDRNGLGRELAIDQLGGTVSLLGAAWARYQSEGAVSPRPGNRSPQSSPHGVFPTLGEDRWVAMAATSDREWHALRALVGDPRLDDDRLFGSLAARKANEDELEARTTTWTADQDRWELARRLQESGVPAAAVADLGEMVTADPQLADYYQAIRQPSAPDLDIWVDAEPIRLAGVTHRLQRAPELGEHSERVLREILGLSREGFDQLVVAGIVR